MNIKKCLDAALAQQHITPDEHADLMKRYTEIAKQVASPSAAKAQLAKEISIEAANRRRIAGLMEEKRVKLLSTIEGYRNRRGEADLLEGWLAVHERLGREGGSNVDDAETLRKVIVQTAHEELTAYLLEFKKGLLTGDLRRRKKAVAARADNVVREMHGEKTGDEAAAALAKAVTAVTEKLRVRFNEAGGTIGKLENWFPHSHDAQSLRDFGQSKWVDYMMQDGVLDREKMVNPVTGRKLSDAELRESLVVSWDRIVTDGWIDREVTGASTGRGALWTQHADHRFIHFKDANAWLAYSKKFGQVDPFVAIMDHINMMARDISHMETFGPNPNQMRSYMRALLSKRAATLNPTLDVIKDQISVLKELQSQLSKPAPDYVQISDRLGEVTVEVAAIRRKYAPQLGGKPSRRNKVRLDALETELQDLTTKILPYWNDPSLTTIEDQAVRVKIEKLMSEMREPILFANKKRPDDYLRKMLSRTDSMWELMRGSQTPESMMMANGFATTRNVITAATLGSAFISSLADPVFGQDMRLRFGMGLARSNFGRIAVMVLRDMVTKGNREQAIRAGLGLDSAMEMLHTKAKENRSIDGRAWSGFVADRILSVQGLAPWTQSGKHLAGLDLQGFLADMTSKNWTALGKQTQKALTAHGFNAESWELVRKTPLHEPRSGAKFLRPADVVAHAGRELGERFHGMIVREVGYAVPDRNLRSKSLWLAGRPGTIGGELWRSMLQFKTYGMTVAMLHANRIAGDIIAGDRSALAPIGALIITGAFLGAIAMALKDIKDGRDPRKWLDEKTYLDPSFWGAAALQAGGLGIYGDFLFSQTGRNNQSFGKTLAGPLVDRVDNVLALTTGNLMQSIRGERTNFGRESVKFARQNTPGANLWMIGLPIQRLVFDQLQKQVDPEAYRALAQQEMTRRRDYRQEFWWRPGQTRPSRAPDLGRVISTR